MRYDAYQPCMAWNEADGGMKDYSGTGRTNYVLALLDGLYFLF